jgi:hypothetical protein
MCRRCLRFACRLPVLLLGLGCRARRLFDSHTWVNGADERQNMRNLRIAASYAILPSVNARRPQVRF